MVYWKLGLRGLHNMGRMRPVVDSALGTSSNMYYPRSRRIEIINKVMKLIIYSPGIWVIHRISTHAAVTFQGLSSLVASCSHSTLWDQAIGALHRKVGFFPRELVTYPGFHRIFTTRQLSAESKYMIVLSAESRWDKVFTVCTPSQPFLYWKDCPRHTENGPGGCVVLIRPQLSTVEFYWCLRSMYWGNLMTLRLADMFGATRYLL